MQSQIARLVETIHKLENELELELAKRGQDLAFTVHGGVAHFEERVLRRHRQLRVGLARYVLGARPLLLITAPVIYAPLLAFVLLDAMVTVYQTVCFPIYGIARVRRRDYLIFDRFPLAYLNLIERINCLYCSYANGLIAYVREIASRTEQYWCPIKHARRVIAAHARYPRFV
ncbi:MAG TPA: hypothetical protein VLX90_08385, partial [Steroidobacteraceae bacterium]|nr:hypothetical protein [Steroidobacteraceae bacterium]